MHFQYLLLGRVHTACPYILHPHYSWLPGICGNRGHRKDKGSFNTFVVFFLAVMGMDTRTPRTTVPSCPTAPSWTQTMMDLEMNVTVTMTTMVSRIMYLLALITVAWFPIPTRRILMVRPGGGV